MEGGERASVTSTQTEEQPFYNVPVPSITAIHTKLMYVTFLNERTGKSNYKDKSLTVAQTVASISLMSLRPPRPVYRPAIGRAALAPLLPRLVAQAVELVVKRDLLVVRDITLGENACANKIPYTRDPENRHSLYDNWPPSRKNKLTQYCRNEKQSSLLRSKISAHLSSQKTFPQKYVSERPVLTSSTV